MSDQPYKPPEADLELAPQDRPGFYVVSKTKFVVLFLATLGVYAVFWFYRNWRMYREHTGQKLWPTPT